MALCMGFLLRMMGIVPLAVGTVHKAMAKVEFRRVLARSGWKVSVQKKYTRVHLQGLAEELLPQFDVDLGLECATHPDCTWTFPRIGFERECRKQNINCKIETEV